MGVSGEGREGGSDGVGRGGEGGGGVVGGGRGCGMFFVFVFVCGKGG